MRRIDDAADEFGISRRRLFQLLAEGKLPRYRRERDRHVYVDREELKKALGYQPVKDAEASKE